LDNIQLKIIIQTENIKKMNIVLILIFFNTFAVAIGQFDPNWWDDRDVIVHLFEWKWLDIAQECERFLSPKGFAGVQISPPTENVIITNRPWWERYQPVSFMLETRSGGKKDFIEMTRRCNAVGIRIYPDIIINHMSGATGIGTGGSIADARTLHYSAVPFGPADFNPDCSINSYQDKYQVRNCRLVGLPDLNQSRPWVRKKIVDMLNYLIDLGVAGFRIDAAKHMWPEDLEAIYGKLQNLNTNFGFKNGSRPFIYQEVIDLGGEAVSARGYIHLGCVTEFKFSEEIGRIFKGHTQLKWLRSFGEGWNFLPSKKALTFVDNHDNQRGHGILELLEL
jgi:alpha-amylase